MKQVDLIKISRLLRLREEIYEDIKDSEEAIIEATMGKFKIPLPPADLPSVFRYRKAKATKVKKAVIRKLDDIHENAFRVVFELDGEQMMDFVRDVRLVRRLLNFDIPAFKMCRIDTVYIVNKCEFAVVETIYGA